MKILSKKFIVTLLTLIGIVVGFYLELDISFITATIVPAVYVIVEGVLDYFGIKLATIEAEERLIRAKKLPEVL